MTPEQYAQEIYWKYSEFDDLNSDEAKKCATIAVDYLIKEADPLMKEYWHEVKSIINRRIL